MYIFIGNKCCVASFGLQQWERKKRRREERIRDWCGTGMGCRSCDKPKMSYRKGLWSPEEDQRLRDFILKNGLGCWSSVPAKAGNSLTPLSLSLLSQTHTHNTQATIRSIYIFPFFSIMVYFTFFFFFPFCLY